MTKAKLKPTQGKQKPIGMREAARMTYSPKNLGKALEARRVSLGLSRIQVSRELSVSPETIRNWEDGKAPLAACRIFSWIFSDYEYEELWKVRALMAEATLRDVQRAMTEYRGSVNGTA